KRPQFSESIRFTFDPWYRHAASHSSSMHSESWSRHSNSGKHEVGSERKEPAQTKMLIGQSIRNLADPKVETSLSAMFRRRRDIVLRAVINSIANRKGSISIVDM